MKTFLLSLFLAPFFTKAQKLYLIDRAFQRPLLVSDTVSLNEVSKGLMPIHVKDIDALLKGIAWLTDNIDNGKFKKDEVKDMHAGYTRFITRIERTGSMNKYNVVLNTKVGNINTSMVVVARENSKRALQRLYILADYLRNNRAALAGSI